MKNLNIKKRKNFKKNGSRANIKLINLLKPKKSDIREEYSEIQDKEFWGYIDKKFKKFQEEIKKDFKKKLNESKNSRNTTKTYEKKTTRKNSLLTSKRKNSLNSSNKKKKKNLHCKIDIKSKIKNSQKICKKKFKLIPKLGLKKKKKKNNKSFSCKEVMDQRFQNKTNKSKNFEFSKKSKNLKKMNKSKNLKIFSDYLLKIKDQGFSQKDIKNFSQKDLKLILDKIHRVSVINNSELIDLSKIEEINETMKESISKIVSEHCIKNSLLDSRNKKKKVFSQKNKDFKNYNISESYGLILNDDKSDFTNTSFSMFLTDSREAKNMISLLNIKKEKENEFSFKKKNKKKKKLKDLSLNISSFDFEKKIKDSSIDLSGTQNSRFNSYLRE